MGMHVESSAMGFVSLNTCDETESEIYGDDMYTTTIPGLGLELELEPVGPSLEPVQPSNPTATVLPLDKAEEDRRIKALVETPALKWPLSSEMHVAAYGSGRGFGRCRGGRLATDHSYGHGGLGSKIPPPGYVCYRCNEPGHFIQHCPTNGDSNYDIKRVKLPTGVPKSMLIANPEGSYVLPSGEIAILKPDEAAFEKEMEGLPTTRPVRDLPPELHCPICKKVMRDAMLTSKCCFSSFCDKCIRDYIISKSMCVCGALNILADDLLPNITLRETINNMESSSSSSETYGSLGKIQDIESARCVRSIAPFPTLSSASKDDEKQPPIRDSPCKKEGGSTSEHKMVNSVMISLKKVATASSIVELSDKTPKSGRHVQIKAPSPTLLSTSKDEDKQSLRYSLDMKESESTSKGKCVNTMMQSLEHETTATLRRVDVLKEKPELISSNEMTSREGGAQGNKKNMKINVPVDTLSGVLSHLGNGNCAGIPFSLSAYNSYWPAGGMPWASEGCMMPLSGAMPYMGFTPGLYGVIPLEEIHPQYSLGPQAYNLSAAPQSCREYSKEREIRREQSSHAVDHHHNDRKRKATTFSSRDEGDNKRKLSELPSRSRDKHSSHRHRANNYQDYHKLTRSTELREKYHFNRRSSCSRDEHEGGRRH